MKNQYIIQECTIKISKILEVVCVSKIEVWSIENGWKIL